MTDAGILTDLARALAAMEAIVAGIQPAQWPSPTPCTELDVRAVLSPLVSGNLLFAAIVRGTTPDRSADHLGSDPLVAFQRAAQQRHSPTWPGQSEPDRS